MEAWPTYSLVDVTDLITCGVAKRPNYVDSGIPFLSSKNVKNGKIIWSDYRHISQEAHNELTKNNKPLRGDVLYTRVGSYGEAAIVDSDDEFSVFVSLTLIKPKHDILYNKYLKYYLNSSEVKKLAKASISGSGVGNLNVGTVRKFPISLPALSEQKRIVAILDQVFADIEQARAKTEQNLKNARELFESYLQQVFSQRGEGWVEKGLKEVSLDFGRGKSKHRPRNDDSLYGGNYPFIQTGAVRNCEHVIKNYSKTYNEKGLAQSKLWPKGTICITIAANIAETGILDFDSCFPDSVIGVVVDPKVTTIRYVEYLLQSFKTILKAKGKGSAQDNINMGTFENMLFPFPEVDKQIEIVGLLDSLMTSVQALERIYTDKLTAIDELKKSILQKSFIGELTADMKIGLSKVEEVKTTSPEFTARILAFVHHQHVLQQRDKTFGRVKAQKTLHLTESISGIDLGRLPIKDAAGPNDFKHMLKAEDWARSNQFFEFVEREVGKGYLFKKLSRYDEVMADTLVTTKPYRKQLAQVVDLIIPMNSNEAEIFTTIHAAWNNLILNGDGVSDDAIIREARENWHPDKMKISKTDFQKAICLIRDEELIPNGKAKRVIGQESLL